jgi:glycosyltransferase involved in cell wall biosynthesis
MKILMQFADFQHNKDRKRLNTYGGIGYYRTIKPSEQIEGHEVTIMGKEIKLFGTNLETQWDEIFQKYDVFWTSYFSHPETAASIFYHAQKHGKKVIIDVDDNYLDVPESNHVYEKFKPGKKDRAFLSTILSFADALTVSTEPLKERLQGHIKLVHGIDKPVYVIPNFNDVKDWNFTPAKKEENRFVIGYSGSNSHQDDLRMVMPAIARIMNEYPNVHFELIGAVGKDKVKEHFAFAGFDDDSLLRVHLKPATATFKEYPEYLSAQPWHVGICPLVDTPFTRAKSHIKWMEYSMYKIPVVASRTYPYYMELKGRDTITDRETGYLCRPNDWYETLKEVIHNYDEAKAIAENAYTHIKTNWQYQDSGIGDTVNKMLSEI